ncbi:MAG: hypothetical protein CML05_03050 [Pseudozobellia sp.]|nr:hypothetical protein [Pseudozobellia sp.]|tara:strand:- start:93509 stop:94708 length:1200 start_codon:yes stop_codon:yes gene_type:complete
MGKKGSVYIAIIVATVAGLMLLQYSKPKNINWFPSYVNDHKIPYGTKVFTDFIETEFPESEQVYSPPFDFLTKNDSVQGTYIFINEKVNFGDTELYTLLDWVDQGNTAYIASNDFEEHLLDTLNLTTNTLFSDFENFGGYKHYLVNPHLKLDKGFQFEKDHHVSYFPKDSLLNAKILGTVAKEKDSLSEEARHPNVISLKHGQGEIILSTFPKAFTNYFILKKENREYTSGLLSYFDGSKKLYFDNHHKSGKSFYTSPMYIFLNYKEFKWAYYLVLIGVIIYIIFEGKRKQRAIPVIRPLTNQTLAFTRTIADMYYESSDADAIARYKMEHFLEYVRNKFYLPTRELNEEFYTNLAARSGQPKDEIKKLFQLVIKLQQQTRIDNGDLQELNRQIEQFKK